MCVCVFVCTYSTHTHTSHILYIIRESQTEKERKENEPSCLQMVTVEVGKCQKLRGSGVDFGIAHGRGHLLC